MKGNIKTGAIYIVLIMLVLGVLSSQLTSGLIPSNQANNTGQIVLPISATPASSQNNLQLNTFGFITATPTPAPADAAACPDDDIKPASCNACPTYYAAACDQFPTCDADAIVMDLPTKNASNNSYCVYVKDNDEAKYNQKIAEPSCHAACVSRLN